MGFALNTKNREVDFQCPHCASDLSCPFVEAGTKQRCPTCRRSFVVPGGKEVQEILDEEAFRLEVARRDEDERQAEEVTADDVVQMLGPAVEEITERVPVAPATPLATPPTREPLAPAPTLSYGGRSMPLNAAVPDYLGLRFGAGVLMIFALLYYIGAVGVLVVALMTLATGTPAGTLGAFTLALAALTSGMVGGLLHALSAACVALRDIARNSFR